MAKDVIFLSYEEPNADAHWKLLKSEIPYAKRVQGISGIREAHYAAAEASKTEEFFVVDGDNEVIDFDVFEYEVPEWDKDYVHIWMALNPVNGLIYGNGGIKLFSKTMFHPNNNAPYADFATTISKHGIKLVDPQLAASIHRFDGDAWHAFRGAYRETAKLTHTMLHFDGKHSMSKVVEASTRLRAWADFKYNWTSLEHRSKFARYVAAGVDAGTSHTAKFGDLKLVNDMDFMKERYENELSNGSV